jgi:hypothetical protein
LSQKYYPTLLRRVGAEFLQFGIAQVIIIVVAIVTLALQIKYGVLGPGDFWPSVAATILPYFGLIFLFILYQLLRVPRLLHEEQSISFATKEAELCSAIEQRDQTILGLQPPKRTPAEQHAYDTLRSALDTTKNDGLTALRHLKNHGTLTFGTYDPQLPIGMTRDRALWVYNHCLSLGIVTRQANLGHSEFVYSISPNLTMAKALDEMLYEDEGLSGFAAIRRK